MALSRLLFLPPRNGLVDLRSLTLYAPDGETLRNSGHSQSPAGALMRRSPCLGSLQATIVACTSNRTDPLRMLLLFHADRRDLSSSHSPSLALSHTTSSALKAFVAVALWLMPKAIHSLSSADLLGATATIGCFSAVRGCISPLSSFASSLSHRLRCALFCHCTVRFSHFALSLSLRPSLPSSWIC